MRIAYFDIAKFIAMMMVILGHFGVPDINRFVYTFHIPLFFLLSGYFFKPYSSTIDLVKVKFRQLIIPYLLVGGVVIFIYILKNLLAGISFSDILLGVWNYFIGFLYGSGYINHVFGYKITDIGPVWFCLALFFGFIILNMLLQYKYQKTTLCIIFCIGYFSTNYIWFPFSIQSAMTAVLFIYIGYKGKQYRIMDYHPSLGAVLPLLCIFSVGINIRSQFLIAHNYSEHLITDIIVALAASYLVLLYCRWLEQNTKISKTMAFLGRYTIVMLCVHSVDVLILPWNDYYKTANTDATVIYVKLLITIFKFILPIAIAYLVSKSPLMKRIFALKV